MERLMRDLGPRDGRVLELRLPGHNVEEIADAVGCRSRTVRRLLDQVRDQLTRRQEDGVVEVRDEPG